MKAQKEILIKVNYNRKIKANLNLLLVMNQVIGNFLDKPQKEETDKIVIIISQNLVILKSRKIKKLSRFKILLSN